MTKAQKIEDDETSLGKDFGTFKEDFDKFKEDQDLLGEKVYIHNSGAPRRIWARQGP